MQRYDWDHIDPDYPEGADRPYQMVCGLTNEFNLVERSNSLNARKGNRFLPWRTAQDEVGSTPINPGDLCQFLNRATGEWVLEEFMGEWWFEQTRELCGSSVAGRRTYEAGTGFWSFTEEQRSEVCKKGSENQPLESKALGGRNGLKTQRKLGIGIFGFTPQQRSERAKIARAATSKETLAKGGKSVNSQRHMCLVTGHISTFAGLSNYQRHRGINLNRRVQLTPEECAFIYLWGESVPKEWLKETAKINLRRTGLTNLKKVTKETRSQITKKLNSTLWLSLATGDISTAAGIHNIHKKAGLDKETSRAKRSKLTPEEAAFIFLWDN